MVSSHADIHARPYQQCEPYRGYVYERCGGILLFLFLFFVFCPFSNVLYCIPNLYPVTFLKGGGDFLPLFLD